MSNKDVTCLIFPNVFIVICLEMANINPIFGVILHHNFELLPKYN